MKKTFLPDDAFLFKPTFNKFALHAFYIITVSIIIYGMAVPGANIYSNSMMRGFTEPLFEGENGEIDFGGILSTTDIWRYLNFTIMSKLYGKSDLVEKGENIMLGVPRLRQLRVQVRPCKTQLPYLDAFEDCYGSYHYDTEETEPFGLKKGAAWMHETIEGAWFWGRFSYYSPNGYYQDFTRDDRSSMLLLKDLADNLWITEATRFVHFSFTIYNPNLNLFTYVRFIFELPPTGSVHGKANFFSYKFIRYLLPLDYIIMACEFVACLISAHTAYILMYSMAKHPKLSLTTIWTYVDIVITAMFVYAIYNANGEQNATETVKISIQDANKYSDFEPLCNWHENFNSAMATIIFFLWIKIFKFLNFNRTMLQLSKTLSRCSSDIAGFFVMFLVVFVAYSQLGYVLFGIHVDDFRTFFVSCMTLVRLVVGDFNYSAIEQANAIFAPIFFLSYVFFVFFILLNMFLAILADTFLQVKSESNDELESEEYGCKNVCENLKLKLMDICGCPRKPTDAKDAKGTDVRSMLKQFNFSDRDIDQLMKKYGLEDGKELSDSDAKDLIEKIMKNQENEGDDDELPGDLHYFSQKEYEKMNTTLADLNTRAKDLLRKLEREEKSRKNKSN